MSSTRLERDPLGEKPVPADALYGIQTLRAFENFPISGLRPLPAFVDAVVWIKRSAALTHKKATLSSSYPVQTGATLSGVRLANASNESCGGSLATACGRSTRRASENAFVLFGKNIAPN